MYVCMYVCMYVSMYVYVSMYARNLLAAAQSNSFSQEGGAQGALQVLRNLRHVEVDRDLTFTVRINVCMYVCMYKCMYV